MIVSGTEGACPIFLPTVLAFGGSGVLHASEWCGRDQRLPFHSTWSACHWLKGGGATETGMHCHCTAEFSALYAFAECLLIDYANYGDFLSSIADLWLFHFN